MGVDFFFLNVPKKLTCTDSNIANVKICASDSFKDFGREMRQLLTYGD